MIEMHKAPRRDLLPNTLEVLFNAARRRQNKHNPHAKKAARVLLELAKRDPMVSDFLLSRPQTQFADLMASAKGVKRAKPIADTHMRQSKKMELIPLNTKLTKDTIVKSGWEEEVKKVLLDLGIEAYYEPRTFRSPGGSGYTPDFVLNIAINGRLVILEPHNDRLFNEEFIEKAMAFRRNHGKKFYTILLSTMNVQMTLHTFGIVPSQIFDEHWNMKSDLRKKLTELQRRPEASLVDMGKFGR